MRTLDNEELLALTADGCSGKLEQQSQQLLPHHLMVRSCIAQDPCKRADLDGCDFCSVWSPRNRAGRQARLPGALIRSLPERSRGILMQPSPSP